MATSTLDAQTTAQLQALRRATSLAARWGQPVYLWPGKPGEGDTYTQVNPDGSTIKRHAHGRFANDVLVVF